MSGYLSEYKSPFKSGKRVAPDAGVNRQDVLAAPVRAVAMARLHVPKPEMGAGPHGALALRCCPPSRLRPTRCVPSLASRAASCVYPSDPLAGGLLEAKSA